MLCDNLVYNLLVITLSLQMHYDNGALEVIRSDQLRLRRLGLLPNVINFNLVIPGIESSQTCLFPIAMRYSQGSSQNFV